MADNKASHAGQDKKSQSPDELLSEQAVKERQAVLAEEDPATSVSEPAAASSNAELDPADRLVNTEKTLPHERASFSRRTLVTNHTPAGLPSDVHQALVSSSQLRRNEAMAYREVQAVLLKYSEYDLPEDVRRHLEAELKSLYPATAFDSRARILLEKYT